MTAEQAVMTAAGIMTAIGVIIAGLYKLYQLFRKLDDAIGEDKNGHTLSDRLERVERQLWENGGSSLADRVNRIETLTIETSAQVSIIKDYLIPAPTQEVKTPRRKTKVQ
jgi:hypothetical protein